MAFNHDGTLLATASSDGTARIWQIPARRPSGRLQKLRRRLTVTEQTTLTGHIGSVFGVAFNHDGTLLATASLDGCIRIWATATGTEQTTLTSHTGPVRAVAFNHDDTLLAITFDDGTARIWQTATGRLLTTLIGLPGAGYGLLLPDGSYKLVEAAAGGLWWAIKLCRFEPGELDPHLPHIRRLPADAVIIPTRRG